MDGGDHRDGSGRNSPSLVHAEAERVWLATGAQARGGDSIACADPGYQSIDESCDCRGGQRGIRRLRPPSATAKPFVTSMRAPAQKINNIMETGRRVLDRARKYPP